MPKVPQEPILNILARLHVRRPARIKLAMSEIRSRCSRSGQVDRAPELESRSPTEFLRMLFEIVELRIEEIFRLAYSGRDYPLNFTYNDAGGIKTITYPDDTVLEYSWFPDGT